MRTLLVKLSIGNNIYSNYCSIYTSVISYKEFCDRIL